MDDNNPQTLMCALSDYINAVKKIDQDPELHKKICAIATYLRMFWFLIDSYAFITIDNLLFVQF